MAYTLARSNDETAVNSDLIRRTRVDNIPAADLETAPMSTAADRITELQRKLAARTNGDGCAKKGYGRNVIALKQEIARLKVLPA